MAQHDSPQARLERADRHQMVLRDFARVAADATDRHWLLEQAARQATRATEVGHAKVMQYRPQHGDLLVVAGTGWKDDVVGVTRLGIDMASPPGRSFQTGQSVVIDDIRDSREFRYPPILQEHGIVSVLHAPVTLDGEVWGVIEVDSQRPRAFDERDVRFFEIFALILSGAVGRLRDAEERENEAKDTARQLAHAETLMREMHHRMKNYFQVIMSLLSLKSGSVKSEHSRAAIHEVMDRVAAITLAHDLLVMRDGQQGVVHAAAYMGALCSSVERMSPMLRIETDLEDAELRIDRAVPLGLILNELIANGLKHAVRDKPDGVIQVTFRAASRKGGEALLRVADNGPGLADVREGASGLTLVRALASQISGRLDIDTSAQGTTVCIHFPLVE